jgi:competence protein ComEC
VRVKKTIIIIAAALLVLGVRVWFVYEAKIATVVSPPSQSVVVRGYLDQEPDPRETSQRLVVRITEGPEELVGERVIFSTRKYPRYRYGLSVELSGVFAVPESFETERGEFHYREYLAAKGIMYSMQSPKLTVLDESGGSKVVAVLMNVKRSFVGNLEQSLGEPHSSLAAGLLVGEKHALGEDLLDEFRIVGLTHIIVLSGYNIAIVVQAISFMFSAAPRTPRLILTALCVVAFAMLVGGGATVVRSTVMALIALFGEFMRRDYSPLRALLVAGYLMVFHNPLILFFDPSFQLSFLATLGLVVLAKHIEEHCSWCPEFIGMRALLASTCATQIAVFPFILYLTGSLSVGGIIVNLLVLPAVPLTMLSVFLTGMAGFVSDVFGWFLGMVSHLLLEYELAMVGWWSRFSWMAAEFSLSGFTASLLYVAYIAIGILIYAWVRKKQQKAAPVQEEQPL